MSGNPGRARVELLETAAAFDAVRKNLVAALIATGVGEDMARAKLVMTIQGLNAVQEILQGVVDTGIIDEAARETLARLAT